MTLGKKAEMLFAHLKRILGLGRLRLRGPRGANDQFQNATTAQNLRKLAKTFPAQPRMREALTRKALMHGSDFHVLRPLHAVFPHNRANSVEKLFLA